MKTGENAGSPDNPRKATRSESTKPPIDIANQQSSRTLSVRLDDMTRERIDSLESDKTKFCDLSERLQDRVDLLSPENSRLKECLKNAQAPGTPEEVWQAIATGPGISSWFVPTEFEERDGKPVAVKLNFGPGMESRSYRVSQESSSRTGSYGAVVCQNSRSDPKSR